MLLNLILDTRDEEGLELLALDMGPVRPEGFVNATKHPGDEPANAAALDSGRCVNFPDIAFSRR